MTPNRWLQVASTIAFVWAGLMLAVSIAIAIPNVLAGGSTAGGLAWLGIGLLAIAYGVCARGLRRVARPYHLLTLVGAVVWSAFLGLASFKVSLVGMTLNAVVAVIVIAQWRHFTATEPSTQAGG